MVVGLEHVLDPHAHVARELEVLVDLEARVHDRRDADLLVPDQIGSTAQVVMDELTEDQDSPRYTRTLSQLERLEAESIHVMREVAAEFERPVLLFSGGKDSIVLRLAEKAFRPAPFPFPVMHVDTGHNFPEVLDFRDRRVDELGERLIVASVQDSIDQGRAVEHRAFAQPAPDRDAARRHPGAPLRRRVRRRPPRRGARPRQGAHLLLPRRPRPVGPARPAAGAVEPLQRRGPPGRARARVPDQQLDRARRLALHRRRGARAAVDLLRARARGLRARRDALRGVRVATSRAPTTSHRSRCASATARSAT